jgi:S-adenosyl methyltransferase
MSARPPDRDDPIEVRYPNTARIRNYQLGGTDNFPVDRAVVRRGDRAGAVDALGGGPVRVRAGRSVAPFAGA